MINKNFTVQFSLEDLILIKNALCTGNAILEGLDEKDDLLKKWLAETEKAYALVREVYFEAMYQLDAPRSLSA